jgi:hypothetical protein
MAGGISFRSWGVHMMGRLGIGHERLGHDICIGVVWRRELEFGDRIKGVSLVSLSFYHHHS